VTEPRLFSLEEANAVMSVLRPLLERLREMVTEAERQQTEIQRMESVWPHANGHRVELEIALKTARATLEALTTDIRSGIREAEAHGCEVKDPSAGLIDFRSPRNGRVVYLCWRLGEGDIAFWHTLEDGFKGRQPL